MKNTNTELRNEGAMKTGFKIKILILSVLLVIGMLNGKVANAKIGSFNKIARTNSVCSMANVF